MKMKSVHERPDGSTKIHNVRFYNLVPRAIHCLAYNKLTKKLAVCRTDGCIEIWDIEFAPYLEKTIPQAPGCSVEGVVWAGERLFTVGLTDELVEWNLQTLQPRRTQHVTGSAIWCIDMNALGSELAIGTEDGYINVFDIEDDQLMYKNLFDKQEGRVLCCKYDGTGKYLVTGSVGAIRIWDVRSGHALHKMNLKDVLESKEVIVWSLQVLKDFTIVSGDSRGIVTVWDGATASEVESHQAMKADVLAVTVNEEENLLICSGVEPVIRIYARTKITREDMVLHRWVKYLQRSVHDHDVKALVCAGERIISGGIDGYVGISHMTKQISYVAKYGPFLQNPCTAVSPEDRLLLLRYTNYLEVWRLGMTSNELDMQITEDADEGQAGEGKNTQKQKLLALSRQPEKLVEFKSKNDEPIVCATVSPNGQWLCYSTPSEIRLFTFKAASKETKQPTQLERVKVLPDQFCVATHLQFSADSKRLFLVNGNKNEILVFNMLSNGNTLADFAECIPAGQHIKDTIHLFQVSKCGTFVAAAGVDRIIAVWSVHQGKYFKHLLNLPRYPATTTALAIHAQQPRIVAAFSDGKIFEYDMDDMCFTCSEREFFVPNGQAHCIRNIVLDERNPDVFVMHTDANLFVVEKCLDPTDPGNADNVTSTSTKKPKRTSVGGKARPSASGDGNVSSLRLKMFKTFEHFISLSWISRNELAAVGVNPVTLIEHLPAAFKQKKFGVA